MRLLPSLRALGRKQSRRKRESGSPSNPNPVRTPRAAEASAHMVGPRWMYRLAILLVVPLVLLGGLELGLRLVGYGYPTGYFRRVTINHQEYLVDNDPFGLRFFPPALARIPPPVVMKAQKPAGTIRIFIFGESAAEGDPRPQFGASRYLEKMLRDRFPQTHFEVVNTAMTAINSHVILPIAKDCSRQNGDIWIVYMGNNEMIGPFGAATAFGRQAPPLGFVRFGLALQRARLGQLLMSGARKVAKSSSPASWGGMEMFLEHKLAPGDLRKETVYKNFERNMADIVRAGVSSGAKVILNTVAVNSKDCPPFASVPESNLAANDLALFQTNLAQATLAVAKGDLSEGEQFYRQAAHLSPRSADAQFGLGECLLAETNVASARECFEAAVDNDALPFRADSRINQAIRRAASHFADRGVVLCDAAAELARQSPAGLAGHEFFYEHVHFNFEGNYRLGLAWANQVLEVLPTAVRSGGGTNWASQEQCERLLGLSDWNRNSILEEVTRRIQLSPFKEQPGNRQRVAAFVTEQEKVQKRMEATPVDEVKKLYTDALQRDPEDFRLHENYADFLEMTHDLTNAVQERRTVCSLIPYYYFPYYSLGRVLKEQGQLQDAEKTLLTAVALNPNQGKIPLELGIVLARQNRWQESRVQLERAHQLSPADPQILLFSAEVHWKLGQRAEAVDRLRQALKIDADYWEAHYRLGEYLVMENRVPEAIVEFKQVLRLQPNYTRAHSNLAVALLRLGLTDEAGREFEETLRLDPKNAQALDFLARQRRGHPRR